MRQWPKRTKKPAKGPNWKANRVKRARAFERAKARFVALISALGGCCAECGEDNASLMSVDHCDGITWDRRSLRYDARVSRYVREHTEGVRLRVLCLPCNGRDGQIRQMQAELAEAPF
jgi:hypothetical protein